LARFLAKNHDKFHQINELSLEYSFRIKQVPNSGLSHKINKPSKIHYSPILRIYIWMSWDDSVTKQLYISMKLLRSRQAARKGLCIDICLLTAASWSLLYVYTNHITNDFELSSKWSCSSCDRISAILDIVLKVGKINLSLR